MFLRQVVHQYLIHHARSIRHDTRDTRQPCLLIMDVVGERIVYVVAQPHPRVFRCHSLSLISVTCHLFSSYAFLMILKSDILARVSISNICQTKYLWFIDLCWMYTCIQVCILQNQRWFVVQSLAVRINPNTVYYKLSIVTICFIILHNCLQ